MVNYDFLTPLIIVILYSILYILRNRIIRIVRKNKLLNFYADGLKDSCSIKINSFKKSLFLPIISIILLNIIIYSSLQITNPEFDIISKFISTFVSPFSEELMFRGILIGFFSVYFFKTMKWVRSKEMKWSIIISVVMLTSLFFMYQHPQPNPLPFFSGILYSALYLYDGRNLTGPVIAHLVNNFIANFIF